MDVGAKRSAFVGTAVWRRRRVHERAGASGCCRSRRASVAVCVFLPPEGVPQIDDDDDDAPPSEAELEKLRRGRLRARSANRYVGADELNELYSPSYTDRLRYVLKPEEQFGAIFTWNAVMENARRLELESWVQVAEEEGLQVPTMEDVVRAEAFVPELAVQRTFFWSADWGRIKSLVFRKVEIFNEKFEEFRFEPRVGCEEWLSGLQKFNVRTCLSANLPRERMQRVLEGTGLWDHFQEFVSIEDETEDFEGAVLLSCERIEKAPQKTVVFCDRPGEVVAAHDVQTKAVALIGAYKAYELRIADECVRQFDTLGIYNVRKLFSQDTEPELEMEVEPELKR